MAVPGTRAVELNGPRPSARSAKRSEYARVAQQWGTITGEEPFGDREEAEIRERLEWWLGDTPNGPGVLAVVEEGGDYLGIAGWCPKRLVIEGEAHLVAEIGTTMTAPSARGRGVFSALVTYLVEVAEERGIKAIYGTPNRASGEIYMGKLGFEGVWPWKRWIRGLRGGPAAASRIAMLMRSGRAKARPTGQPSVISDFSRTAGLSPSGRHPHIAKDTAYLSWRYPSHRYKAYSISDSEGIAGWVVIGTATRIGRPAMVVADALAAERAVEGLDGLILWALGEAERDFGKRPLAFTMTGPGGDLDRAFRRIGGISRPSEMPLIVKAVGDGNEVAEAISRMTFVAGDSDTV